MCSFEAKTGEAAVTFVAVLVVVPAVVPTALAAV